MTSTFLSIDWDFFFYRGFEAKVFDKKIYSFYDWQHSETQSPVLMDIIWATRFMAFKQAGLDPYRLTGWRKEVGCTHPKDFVEELEQRFDLDHAPEVFYGDSHRHAYYGISAAHYDNHECPIPVTHFDAHHDLGYKLKTVEAHREEGVYDCADWLLHAIECGLVSELTVVYPNWRGLSELEGATDPALVEHFKTLPITFTVWDDWLKAQPPGPLRSVSSIHIARSSAWVPPWFDKDFEEFTESFSPNAEHACAECSYDIPDNSGLHGCDTRTWQEPKFG